MDQKVEQKRKEKIWLEEKAMGDFEEKLSPQTNIHKLNPNIQK